MTYKKLLYLVKNLIFFLTAVIFSYLFFLLLTFYIFSSKSIETRDFLQEFFNIIQEIKNPTTLTQIAVVEDPYKVYSTVDCNTSMKKILEPLFTKLHIDFDFYYSTTSGRKIHHIVATHDFLKHFFTKFLYATKEELLYYYEKRLLMHPETRIFPSRIKEEILFAKLLTREELVIRLFIFDVTKNYDKFYLLRYPENVQYSFTSFPSRHWVPYEGVFSGTFPNIKTYEKLITIDDLKYLDKRIVEQEILMGKKEEKIIIIVVVSIAISLYIIKKIFFPDDE